MEAMSAGGNISVSKQFGVDFNSDVVVVSMCTKDAQIVHGGVNRGTKMIWCFGGGPIRVLGGTPTVGFGGKAFSIHRLLHQLLRGKIKGERGGRHGGR